MGLETQRLKGPVHLHQRTGRVAINVETKYREEIARMCREWREEVLYLQPREGLLRSRMKCQRGQSWKLASQRMSDSNKVGGDSGQPGV